MADQEGIVELLSHLDEDEIFALAKTVTQGLLKTENKNGKIWKFTHKKTIIESNFRCNNWNTKTFAKCCQYSQKKDSDQRNFVFIS